MEKLIEATLLGARWLLLPLYLGLLAAVLAIYAVVGRELYHLVGLAQGGSESDIVLIILSVLDLVLIANLLVMVAISSYESFVSRIAVADIARNPEWLGKLDSGNVKLKVALSIVMISAIHLLRGYVNEGESDHLPALAGVHLVFVVSALAVAVVDRLNRAKPSPTSAP